MAKLHYHGHSTCTIETNDGTRLVIDPFFDGNPACDTAAADVEADFILVSHAHGDHIADLIPIAKRTGAQVISSHELVTWLATQGVENGHGMSIGGAFDFPFGSVKLTPAEHGARNEGPGGGEYPTTPAGLLIKLKEGKRVYHAGDTSLLMDMQLLKGQVDVALLPIGDNFTMGPDDAVRAVELIEPEVVIPIHYNTWPLIAQDPAAFKAKVGKRARVEVVAPGSSCEL